MTEYNLSSVAEAVAVLSEEIRRSPYNMRQIAQRTRMNPQTVSRIFYQEVRFPRAGTLMTLFAFFGYAVVARPSNVARIDDRRKAS